MALMERLTAVIEAIPATLTESKGVFSFSCIVAERKAFFCRQKLVYSVNFRIDDSKKELLFWEMLKEHGFGLGISNTSEGMSPGFGFKKSTYKIGFGPREETIEEQSKLFGKKYSYTFEFGSLRRSIQAAVVAAGYSFTCKFIL